MSSNPAHTGYTMDPTRPSINTPKTTKCITNYKCSSPRKEKHSKTQTGKYIVPHERISIVNPNGGKKIGIPDKESPGIPNPREDTSWRQNELIPMCQRENYSKDPSWP